LVNEKPVIEQIAKLQIVYENNRYNDFQRQHAIYSLSIFPRSI